MKTTIPCTFDKYELYALCCIAECVYTVQPSHFTICFLCAVCVCVLCRRVTMHNKLTNRVPAGTTTAQKKRNKKEK